MKLKGVPDRIINRFGNVYKADSDGYIEATTKKEMEVFVAYGYKLEQEPEVIQPKKKTKK